VKKPVIYLAGPVALHPGAGHLIRFLREMCAAQGFEAIAPESGGDAALWRRTAMDRIRASDVVIACISPFRGPGADPGTAFEMGYAEGLGKPVIAWSEEPKPYIERVPHDKDADGRAFCKQHGMLVEDFGLADNLMLAAGALPVQASFEAALAEAKRLMLS
jgi:nucleoside 2-deoxyribosyltransferase